MTILNTQTLEIPTQDNFNLETTIYKPAHQPKGVIVYYHGGGLIFGTPDDLPIEIKEILTQNFYLVEAPYRLAPEASYDTILSDALTVFDAIQTQFNDLPIFTFGRSSGGYLAFQIAKQREVAGILDFYATTQINIPEFRDEHQVFKQQTSHLSEAMIQFMLQPNPITNGPSQFRYPLYLYTRGNGIWYDYLKIKHPEDPQYNLSDDELSAMPPVFIAHARGDIDVPYSESLRVMEFVQKTKCITIESDAHDFDRQYTVESKAVYEQAVAFLLDCIKDQD